MPKRSPKSKRGIWAEISSIPQQASPNCSHHSDERRAQLKRKSSDVMKTFFFVAIVNQTHSKAPFRQV